MNSPIRAIDAQRWLRFTNAGTDAIPPFAVLGPQMGAGGAFDAVEATSESDFALRLGRPHAAERRDQDGALWYLNGPQEVRPNSMGRCTQTGMMQALIGYPKDKSPAWGDRLSIDTSQAPTPFYLVPGGGGYRFVDFDGCPKTTFKDARRTDYQFRVGWIVPASQSTALDGVVIKDNGTLATLAAGGILPLSGRDNPELATFGLSDRVSSSSETASLRARGFHRIHTTGSYLLNFTARIRSTDSDININVSGNLKLICRTNRIGNSEAFYTADQIEALAADGELVGDDYAFHQLRVGAEDQPADTNRVEGEVVEKHRHWQTVTGSTVLSMTEGELLLIYNPTGYELEVSGVSGTLVLLSGATTGGGTASASTSTNNSNSSGGESCPGGASSEAVDLLDSRMTTVESDVGTLEATVAGVGTTLSMHTASIAASAAAISSTAADVTDHTARIADLESFEASATPSITAAAAGVSSNATDIATHAAAIGSLETFQAAAAASIAAAATDIDALETFQATTEQIFAAAISDGTITTAAGDEITTAAGVVTAVTKGPVSLPGTLGTSREFLKSNGVGGSTWSNVVHQYWSENGGGHLVADTSNLRDIGTSSKKIRSIYIGSSATIDGTLSVGGTNIASAVATHANHISELQSGVNYGNFIDGLRINSHSEAEHDLEIGTGRCASSDGTAVITCGTAVVLEIDSASHRVDGSSLDAHTDYYVLAGMDDGSFVAGFSKVNSLPPGWDTYRAIGFYRTDASENLRETSMRSHDRFVTFQSAPTAAGYLSTNTPTTGTLVDTLCPRVAGMAVDCQSIAGAITNGSIINMANGDFSMATANNGPRKHYHPPLGSFGYTNVPVTLLTNSSGQVYHWCYDTGAGTLTRNPTESLLTILGYYWSPF